LKFPADFVSMTPAANGLDSWDDAKAVHPLGDVLTVDEARSMAEEFAKLPEP
jgi:hypothetical protein